MLKHKEFGIYQGSCMGMGFWHPMSGMPEQGLYEFPTPADIQEYRDFLCSSKCSSPLNPQDLEILPFNKELSDSLIKEIK